MRLLLASWLLGIFASGSFAQPPAPIRYTTPQFQRQVDELMEEQIRADHFSGVVLVARDSAIIYERAGGVADNICHSPVNLSTRFNLGAVSHLFTNVALAKLAEEGKLSLSDTLGKFIGSMHGTGPFHSLTIDSVARHPSTYGIPLGAYFSDKPHARFRTMLSYLGFITDAAKRHADAEPGEVFNQAAFLCLGFVIEKASGQDFYDYMQEEIFKPLGMDSTGFFEQDNLPPNTALGLTREREFGDGESPPDTTQPRASNIYWLPARGNPLNGAYSTAHDLFRFFRSLDKGHWLSPESARWISGLGLPGSQAALTGRDKPAPPYFSFYFYSLAPGINTVVNIDAQLHSTIIVLSNYDSPGGYDLGTKIQTLLSRVRD